MVALCSIFNCFRASEDTNAQQGSAHSCAQQVRQRDDFEKTSATFIQLQNIIEHIADDDQFFRPSKALAAAMSRRGSVAGSDAGAHQGQETSAWASLGLLSRPGSSSSKEFKDSKGPRRSLTQNQTSGSLSPSIASQLDRLQSNNKPPKKKNPATRSRTFGSSLDYMQKLQNKNNAGAPPSHHDEQTTRSCGQLEMPRGSQVHEPQNMSKVPISHRLAIGSSNSASGHASRRASGSGQVPKVGHAALNRFQSSKTYDQISHHEDTIRAYAGKALADIAALYSLRNGAAAYSKPVLESYPLPKLRVTFSGVTECTATPVSGLGGSTDCTTTPVSNSAKSLKGVEEGHRSSIKSVL